MSNVKLDTIGRYIGKLLIVQFKTGDYTLFFHEEDMLTWPNAQYSTKTSVLVVLLTDLWFIFDDSLVSKRNSYLIIYTDGCQTNSCQSVTCKLFISILLLSCQIVFVHRILAYFSWWPNTITVKIFCHHLQPTATAFTKNCHFPASLYNQIRHFGSNFKKALTRVYFQMNLVVFYVDFLAFATHFQVLVRFISRISVVLLGQVSTPN